ncbi:MAG: glycosyltransferase family 2 protein [Flavobacterium sp.]|nr:MAG: glycosyltransferase family 2 protein [Flavobacterium sp.]
MKYAVVIPAYNEAAFIEKTLDSVSRQKQLPSQVVVVNDNSTDETAQVVTNLAAQFHWIKLINIQSDAIHLPGSKVIRAFQNGLEAIDADFEIIVKLDADLILPENYFETILTAFKSDPKIGMAGGFAYIEKNGEWVLENLTDKDHIRGAFKAYRKQCFADIGGLRPAMGWDTVDELLARFHGWKVVTFSELKVKHLKPTGARYDETARFKQGEAFYSLGYGFWITSIASAKLAMMKKKPLLFADYLRGYFKAKSSGKQMLVTAQEANWIRHYRWTKMKSKLFG